jgi:hypothetical protein
LNNECLYNEVILNRINEFIAGEGYRKDYLASRMKKSPSTFYAHLQGKHEKSTYRFVVELAEVLGLDRSFFIGEEFHYTSFWCRSLNFIVHFRAVFVCL